MNIFTIGFTKSTAENFFKRLEGSNVIRVVDVRLKADSQLAGFAKRKDLAFFLPRVSAIEYTYEPLLAPSAQILESYRKGLMTWSSYADAYLCLISDRKVEERISPETLDGACLLCSEDTAHHCHRRLAAEYLQTKWVSPIGVTHL